MNGKVPNAFISHASEDKESVARPLASELEHQGWSVWIDENELTAGDSLWERINSALSACTYGIVILSPSFFAKEWALRELQGLAAKEISSGNKLILPVWHELDSAAIANRFPLLADRLGIPTSQGIEQVAAKLVEAFDAQYGSGSPSHLLVGSIDPAAVSDVDLGESEIAQYARRYRDQVRDRCSRITPPHVDSTRRIAINNLYVAPSLDPLQHAEGEEPESLPVDRFIESFSRAVVLGNPGSGKSTLSQKICYDISVRSDSRTVPVLITLREYGSRREEGVSLAQYVHDNASTVYQLPEPPEGTFDALFRSGRCVVVFDGLDELLDPTYRQEIAQDVESFCNLYPAIPVIVTSREVGYSQAPLDEDLFSLYRLSNFDEQSVQEYAEKWFRSIPDLPRHEGEQLAKSFVEESQTVPDLRSNALMLALMCNIYRGERYIPRNRPDVYEKCAKMLFERWDRSRGITVPLPFESLLFPVMQYLAYWIYSDQDLQSGVPAELLVSKTSEYLAEWQYEDSEDARQAAKKFVEVCTGRAWVFSDAGLTPSGTSLYHFTHRTFLEYFTAAYLARQATGPEDLMKVLIPHICRREWDIVGQLAVQLANQAHAGAGDVILDQLLELASDPQREAQERWNLLAFAAKALHFLTPRPKCRRAVTYAIFTGLIANLGPPKDANGASEALSGIHLAARENLPAIVDEVEKTLHSALSQGSREEQARAADLALHHLPVEEEGATSLWPGVTQRVWGEFSPVIASLGEDYEAFGVDSVLHGDISLAEFVSWHGTEAVFNWLLYPCFESVFGASLSDRLINWSCFGFLVGTPEVFLRCISEVPEVFLPSATPWLGDRSVGFRFPHVVLDPQFRDPEMKLPKLDSKQLFGLFCLLAPQIEARGAASARDLKAWVEQDASPVGDVAPFLLARKEEGKDFEGISGKAVELGFPLDHRNFINGWASGDIDLVSPSPDTAA